MAFLKQLSVIALATFIVACGGGGGSGDSSGGGGPDAIGLTVDGLDRAAYLSLANTTSDSTRTTLEHKSDDKLLAFVLRSARAAVPATNNVLAYDVDGEPLPNPLSTDVSVLISDIAEDPAGENLYLAIQDRHNSAYFDDYAALQGERCTLYRIEKESESVSCLAVHTQYDPYLQTANGELADNSSESFIKFDNQGNGYYIAFDRSTSYGTHGTEKQRLVKVSGSGDVTTVRDIDGYNARGLVYARNGKLLFVEETFTSTLESDQDFEQRAHLFDPDDESFESIDHPDGLDKLASSADRRVFWSQGVDVYRFDQGNKNFERILSGVDDRITALHRSQTGDVFAQLKSGKIWSVGQATPTVIADVGEVPRAPSHPAFSELADNSSNFTYPYIASSERWLLSRGSTSAGDPTICVVDLQHLEQTCSDEVLHDYVPEVHTLAVIADRGYGYFAYNGIFYQAELDLENYVSSPSTSTSITESTMGDGSAVATVSLRPPITARGDLETVSVESSFAQRAVDDEKWTELYFDFSAPITHLSLDDVAVVESGVEQSATFSMTDSNERLVVTFPGADGSDSPEWIDPQEEKTYTLQLTDEVRLPGQTFLSAFEREHVSVTID